MSHKKSLQERTASRIQIEYYYLYNSIQYVTNWFTTSKP